MPKDQKLSFLVSSGGTNVPIDSVRCITNYSKGTTGSLIGQEIAQRGHNLKYLYSSGAQTPFAEELRLNTSQDLDIEIDRLKKTAELYKDIENNIQLEEINDFNSYHNSVQKSLKDKNLNVFISVMAASDFGVDYKEGKI